MKLDPVAVSIFANKGVALIPVVEKDYCWTHDPYFKTEPLSKDIEIRIREKHYMGAVVHRVTVPNVYFEDAHAVAEKVLADFKASITVKA